MLWIDIDYSKLTDQCLQILTDSVGNRLKYNKAISNKNKKLLAQNVPYDADIFITRLNSNDQRYLNIISTRLPELNVNGWYYYITRKKYLYTILQCYLKIENKTRFLCIIQITQN